MGVRLRQQARFGGYSLPRGLRGPERGCRGACGTLNVFRAGRARRPRSWRLERTNPARRRSATNQAGAIAVPCPGVLEPGVFLADQARGFHGNQPPLADNVDALDEPDHGSAGQVSRQGESPTAVTCLSARTVP